MIGLPQSIRTFTPLGFPTSRLDYSDKMQRLISELVEETDMEKDDSEKLEVILFMAENKWRKRKQVHFNLQVTMYMFTLSLIRKDNCTSTLIVLGHIFTAFNNLHVLLMVLPLAFPSRHPRSKDCYPTSLRPHVGHEGRMQRRRHHGLNFAQRASLGL